MDRCTTIIALLVAVPYSKASITVRVSQVCTLVLLHVAAAAQSSVQVEKVGIILNYEAAPARGDSRRRLISKGTGECLEVGTCWCNLGHIYFLLVGIGFGSSLRWVRSAVVSGRGGGRGGLLIVVLGVHRVVVLGGVHRVVVLGGVYCVVVLGGVYCIVVLGGVYCVVVLGGVYCVVVLGGVYCIVVLGVHRGRGGLLDVVLGVSDGL